MSRVGTWMLNRGLGFPECAGLDGELPFKVGMHFALHLVSRRVNVSRSTIRQDVLEQVSSRVQRWNLRVANPDDAKVPGRSRVEGKKSRTKDRMRCGQAHMSR